MITWGVIWLALGCLLFVTGLSLVAWHLRAKDLIGFFLAAIAASAGLFEILTNVKGVLW